MSEESFFLSTQCSRNSKFRTDFIINISSGCSDGGGSRRSSNKSFCLRLSSSSLSPHLVGWYSVELELHPP